MFQRILVPLDGSKLAEQAIPHASGIARIFHSEIILFHALDSTPYIENQAAVEPLNWQIRKAQAEQYLQGIAAHFRARGLHASAVLREGKTAENIVDFAHTENIDLLVLTTHGASGLSRWNTSSVVQKVLEKIYLPLLLVRSFQPMDRTEPVDTTGQLAPANRTQSTDSALSAGIDTEVSATSARPMDSATSVSSESFPFTETSPAGIPEEEAFIYQRILLPIDSSRRAECALPPALALAQPDAHLILAAVIRPPDLPIPAPYPAEINTMIQQLMRVSADAAAAYLEEQQRRLPGRVETRVVEAANVSAALHELSVQEDVDLVILCAHGQTGGTQWPYGSIARNYLEHGERAVLVIQDVARAQTLPTAAEQAAQKYGRR